MKISGEWVIDGLTRISKILKIREFVVGFFIMAAASSLPNLFVGITSAGRGIPELSLGDVFGNNFVAMTLAVAAAILFSARKEIETGGKTVQATALFTMTSALLPVILLFDSTLSRADGLILIVVFIGYLMWLFRRQEHFSRIYNDEHHKHLPIGKLKRGLKDIGLVLVGIALLFVAAIGIVASAKFFALSLGVPLLVVGILITGLGNALPEIYFAVASARRGETQMIIGNIMGSVIFPATLVLGIVAIIHPITVTDVGLVSDSRAFLFAAAILFFVFAKTKGRINIFEGAILALLYLAFVVNALF